MNLLRRRRDLACRQVVELVTEYLEDTLSRNDRARFERHLRSCPNCTAYLDQMRETIAATGRLTAESLTPEASAAFTALYRAWRAEGPPDGDAPG